MISLKKSVMIAAAFCLAGSFASQAMVTIQIVKTYFTETQPMPSDFIYSVFWLGAGVEYGNTFPEEYAIKENRLLEGSITPLQIAAQVKSQVWLKFLLESNQPPFTETVALRKKIEHACLTNMMPNFTEKNKHHINQPLNQAGDTAIILAARADRRDLVERLKELGANEQQENIAGENAQELMVTFEEVVHYFTQRIPDPDSYDYMWLWAGSDEGIGKEPVEYVIIKNRRLNCAKTPLQIAVEVKSQAWLKFLLESNQPPFTEIVKLRTKIFNAGNSEAKLELTDKEKSLINQPLNDHGDTAIILANLMGCSDLIKQSLVEQLKALGADPARENIGGLSALSLMN